MPNWVQNKLRFNGDEQKIRELLKKVVIDNEFDFNAIIPMPKEYENSTSGSSEHRGLHYWFKHNDETREGYDAVKNFLNKNHFFYSDLDEEQISDEDKRVGEQAASLIIKYGYPDWYDWRISNWGCKWNASETSFETYENELTLDSMDSIEGLIVKFHTPWSYPDKVIQALSKQFPDIEIQIDYADEDMGSNCNSLTYKDGDIIREEDFGDEDTSEWNAKLIFALDVWDYGTPEENGYKLNSQGCYEYSDDEE